METPQETGDLHWDDYDLQQPEKALTEEKQRRFVAQAVLERDDIVDCEWIQ